jgi:hypothetical protein
MKNIRGKASAPSAQVTRHTVQRHTNEVRKVGGAVPTRGARKLDSRGMSAVTAMSTSANNGQWTERICRKDRQNRRVTTSTIPGFVQTPEMAARVAARKARFENA